MSIKYKRLTTTQVVNGRNIKTITSKGKVTIQDLIDRLWELEDKIEAGTLIELPVAIGGQAGAITNTEYPDYDFNAVSVGLMGLAYIVCYDTGDVGCKEIDSIYKTRAEAEKKLEEIKNGNNDRVSE